jgi:hypothetical protein
MDGHSTRSFKPRQACAAHHFPFSISSLKPKTKAKMFNVSKECDSILSEIAPQPWNMRTLGIEPQLRR